MAQLRVPLVLVVHNDVTHLDGVEDEQRGIDFLEDLLPGSGPWVQTSTTTPSDSTTPGWETPGTRPTTPSTGHSPSRRGRSTRTTSGSHRRRCPTTALSTTGTRRRPHGSRWASDPPQAAPLDLTRRPWLDYSGRCRVDCVPQCWVLSHAL